MRRQTFLPVVGVLLLALAAAVVLVAAELTLEELTNKVNALCSGAPAARCTCSEREGADITPGVRIVGEDDDQEQEPRFNQNQVYFCGVEVCECEVGGTQIDPRN